uniref:Intercellular transfer by conjugation n=1 Tax=uncultured bacterium IN-11 TaxID=1805589 RepID=A0A142BW91_9BACT|nr:intercellular transfer by conjugation [uncultured bacterium IN-11]
MSANSELPEESVNNNDQGSSIDDLSALEKGLVQRYGIDGLVRLGLANATERTTKNRLILFLGLALCGSVAFNFAQWSYTPEPRLLETTADGRIRDLPLLTEKLYDHGDILDWAESCVKKAYKLSYVDWEEKVRNETYCFSDSTRKEFVSNLGKIGLLDVLTPEKRGVVYPTMGQALMISDRRNQNGYNEWRVDIPYRINVDGRSKGSIDVVMSALIRRVPMSLRGDGLWIDSYVIRSVGAK